ncbi:MAG: hypothetical protein PHX07_01815 [Candidatus Marinimicrobia bacterium]|jgi:Spy/CpxP family protein refolding chaperone|nr:hypothetical protein [Candidatus Neomarinimicrobiota bacterium]MDD5710044.1 hypothetical protein [Candidatus Neomarinimicrobiota bacterium]MDX9777209.1 hypothetical protein [bacterium]
MKKTVILLLGIMIAAMLSAKGWMQDAPPSRPAYYQFMVFRLTEDLSLSEEQAERFFPLHRSYQDQKRLIHHKTAMLSKDAYEKKNIDKAGLERYKDQVKQLALEEIELDAAFYVDLEQFLRPEQVLHFIFFDHHFRNELSRELKERYGNDTPGKKHRKK